MNRSNIIDCRTVGRDRLQVPSRAVALGSRGPLSPGARTGAHTLTHPARPPGRSEGSAGTVPGTRPSPGSARRRDVPVGNRAPSPKCDSPWTVRVDVLDALAYG